MQMGSVAGRVKTLIFGKNQVLDPDPQIFGTLDPDPHRQIFQSLDPNPHEMDADPKASWRGGVRLRI